MEEWILILFLYAGTLSSSDSVSLVAVHGFKSEIACINAGQKAERLETFMKNSKFICVNNGVIDK